ncbi:PREDICTED: oxygen-regulated protein 1-like [Cyprinodon variegatus]|uniref:oxygen-regulated protein 1-like n=1 Tax=Cyprinodon variegatus TaxID=28743 RepID=UPI00074270F5|nr:PREDICTED: oxygen-regulated protein 1-like [Cyprinodon variegatus]
MNETGLRRTLPDQSSGSGHTFETSHHTSVTSTILSKRVCFYKSGDPQFNGLRVVINNRTFKTFDALLDSLSKKVPLPFGVRNITTPRGIHGIKALDDFEDGKSYICSDSRKVKPIDLALARKRLPPWYHARPVSPNRKTARFFPGRKKLHREEQGIVHTPKKLVVFRNGDPSVRHTVLLQRKTTPSYESILRHISELMQFHVNKLHTLDGRRIDGLPGLILCSGSVVAVGREPFRHVVYSMEKYPSSTRQHTKRRVSKKQKTSVSKKMTPSFSSKSRNFSASSERYIVQQIHASMGESSCDLPSNAANSIESDSDRILESLAETDEDICLGNGGNEGQDGDLPNDDNIEKSFRVNEDGSMTVEMKVRLTIKEEESVQWTTTLTRSVVADQLNMSSLPHSDPEQEVCSRNSQTSAASNDIIHKDRTSDDNDDDPPSLGNRASSDNFQDEDDLKNHTEVLLPRREPTPGCKRIRESQASVDSIKSVDEDDFGEGKVGSCFLEEQTENVTTKEQFYMENQTSTKPVPKPRRLGSVDVISRDSSALKSTEIMQTESSGDEVTETVLHIYEQHTYQDNFLANVGVHSMSASGVTSQNRQNCSSNEFEAELWPSPAFEPDSGWRADSMSVTLGLQLASLNIGAIQGPKREQLPKSKKSQVKPGDNESKKDLRVSSKPKLTRKNVQRDMTPETKMSPKKEPLNEPALDNYATEEETVLSVPTISNARKEICSTVTAKKVTATSEEIPQPTLERGTPSFCTSVSPLSLTSDERMSSSSIISSETSVLGSIEFEETKISDMPKIEEKSPKSLAKKAKLKSSPSPERKMQSKNSSELQNTSTKNSAGTRHIVDKDNLSQKGLQKPEKPKVSPSAERKHHELQRPSPYSHSLDVVSPPSRHKSSKKLLPRNVSLDNPLQSKNGKLKKSSQREGHQPALLKADISGDTEAVAGDQVISVMPEPIHSVDQPNMKPVLEKICYSIKSIRQITQSKRPSCLEKSNSLPDFSSHVASTFGSSSKVLLAFLAVMTLKDGLANLNMKELNAYNVSCAEALKMIDSLREIANIEDSQRLRISLSNLQKSASMQLLQSWKGFQDKSTNLISSEAAPEFDCGIGENVIDQIIDNLDIPKRLKDELVSLSDGESDRRGNRHSSRLKLLADQLIHENTGEDTVTHDEKDNSDVRSIVKQIPDIKKPAQTELDSTPLFSEAGKYKTTRQVIEDRCCQNWSNSVADSEYNPEEKKTFNIMSLDLQSCTDEAQDNPEKQKQHQRACLFEKLPQKGAESVDLYSRIEPAKQETYMDANQLTQNEKNTLYTEIIKEARSDLAEGHQMIRSANKDCFKQYTEERAEVTDHGTKQGISASSNYYAEVKVKGKKTAFNSDCKNLYDPIEIKSKVSQSQRASMGLNISTNGSTGSLNVDDPSSLEEQQEVNYKKLHVIIEESLSGNEKEEEEPLDYLPKFAEETKAGRDLEALIEESENEQFSSEDEIQYAPDELKQQGSPNRGSVGALENPDLCSLITNKSLGYGFRSNVDDDSGNDHSSFEEHMYEVQLKDEDKQKSNLTEEELSYYENDFSSEEEETSRERRLKQRTAELQETPLRVQLEELNTKGIVESLKHQSDEVLSKSVAERVTLLEKQVAEAQKPKPAAKSSTIRLSSQRKSPPESEDSPSESPASEMLICTRSAPQSSLSFSYDSSGVITTEPEGSRVRSIREMFLARSATDIQQRGFLGPSSSELRAETSGSGGYQSQTSTDLSGNEDDSPRKSISKGFVRRAIEMLYGKKDPEPEEVSERSPSEPDQRKREPSSILSPFHAARSKAMSEFSYFNSSNALDIFSEATRCITFNAQVGPGDSVPIDNGRWLLRENTQMRKSVSDPVGINKTLTNTFYDDGFCKDKEEKTPYLLFSSKPELQTETKSQPGKCTYFSLPHASESEACQDEMSVISKDSKNEDSVEETKDASEDSKTWTERNGALPGIGVIDFKMKDNKVHPLVELPPDGEVVVVQPGKGQGVINRRIQEPDVLDLLYHFCGEHCPIL